MKLTIVIPVYNEEKTIELIIQKITRLNLGNVDKEIIVVDDGSTDKSLQLIKQIITNNKAIKCISHKKNLGKGAAIQSALRIATGEYVLIQDADLEYSPEYIPQLLHPVQTGMATVVYGTRINRLPNLVGEEKKFLFLLHYFGNRMLSLVTSLFYGEWITDMETGYKLFPKKAVSAMNLHARSFDFEPEITAKLLKSGHSILEIPIVTKPRGYNEGKKLNTVRDGLIAVWTLVKYRFID